MTGTATVSDASTTKTATTPISSPVSSPWAPMEATAAIVRPRFLG